MEGLNLMQPKYDEKPQFLVKKKKKPAVFEQKPQFWNENHGNEEPLSAVIAVWVI